MTITETRDFPKLLTRSLPGDPGFWVFIGADAAMFAALFLQFSIDWSAQPEVFRAGHGELNIELGTANTLVLVTSSYLLALAIRSIHNKDARTAHRLITGTIVCGLIFAILKVAEYGVAIDAGHTISTSPLFMYYFMITGIHLAHLIGGVIVLLVIRVGLDRDSLIDRSRLPFVESAASYWHLVDLLWMFIFPLLYLVR